MISEDRLRNWGRFVRLGRFHRGHCASIEHRAQGWYNPPQPAQIEWLYAHGLVDELERAKLYADIPKARAPVVNAADADLIEFGWRWVSIEKQKKALKWRYVKLWTNLMLSRQLRERDIDTYMLLVIDNLSFVIDKISAMAAIGVYPTADNLIRHRISDLPVAA